MDVHGLDGNAARAGEAVPKKLAGAGEETGGKPLHDGFHLHGTILVNPAAGFDINLFAGLQGDFKHIAVAMEPEDAFAGTGAEGINKEAGAAEQHVGHAAHAGEGEINAVGGGQKLVFAHIHSLAGLQVQGENVAGAVAAEGDASRAGGGGHEHGHAGEDAFKRAAHGLEGDFHRRILPEQDVMLEIDGGGVEFHVQDGNEFTFNVIGDAAEGFFGSRRGEQFGNSHK